MARGVTGRRPSAVARAARGQALAGACAGSGFFAVAAAVFVTSDPPQVPRPVGLWLAVASLLLVALVGGYYGLLRYAIPPHSPGTRRGRWWLTGAFAVFAVLDRWWLTGTFAAALLPAVFVVVCGVWLFRVADRRLGGAARPARVAGDRFGRARRWAARRVPDGVITVTAAFALVVLFNPAATLTSLPAAVLLLPVGVAAAFRVRRSMAASGRVAVRAGADIVLSLLLGLAVTLFVVWAANVLHLTHARVAAVRGTLARVGALADVPWYVWLALYAALAAACALPYGKAYAGGVRAARGVAYGQRTLSVVHVGLLVVALVGGSAPTALAWSLRGPVHAGYTLALQRERDAAGATAAYTEIRRAFSSAAPPPTALLSDLAVRIHRRSPPTAGSPAATAAERRLARRLGHLQGITGAGSRGGGRDRGPAVVPDGPVHGARDLDDHLARLDRQWDRAGRRTARARLAGDLAAQAVARLVSAPGLGDTEVAQVVREYLAGLVEESPLNRAFSAWAAHRPGAPRPDVVRAVVPNPVHLWEALSADLSNAARPRGDGRIDRGVFGGSHVRPGPFDVD